MYSMLKSPKTKQYRQRPRVEEHSLYRQFYVISGPFFSDFLEKYQIRNFTHFNVPLDMSILNIWSTSGNLQHKRFRRYSYVWSSAHSVVIFKRAWSFWGISSRIEAQSQFLNCSLGSYQPRTVEIFSPKLSAYISQPGPTLT